MIKTLILLYFVAVCTSSLTDREILADINKHDTKALFKAFHYVHKRSYDINSQQALEKYKIFKDNLAYIKNQNSIQDEMTLGITPFADMTLEEFSNKLKGKFNVENNGSDDYVFDKMEDSNFKARFLSEKVYDSNYFDKYADAEEEPIVKSVEVKDKNNKVYDSNYFDKYADAEEEPVVSSDVVKDKNNKVYDSNYFDKYADAEEEPIVKSAEVKENNNKVYDSNYFDKYADEEEPIVKSAEVRENKNKVYDSNYFDKHADADEEPVKSAAEVKENKNKVYDSNYFDKYADADEEIPQKQTVSKPKVQAPAPLDWKEYLLQKPQPTLKCNQDSVYFAIVDLLEAQVNFAEDVKEPLSAQALVDCVSKYEERCKTTEISSGVFSDAKKKTSGIPKESEYGSYTGIKSECKKMTPFVDWISEKSCLEPERALENEKKYVCTQSLIDEIIAQGPYITRIDPYSREFQLYKGGWLMPKDCVAINSYLTVLVHSVTKKTVEFKAYLGEDWGMNGHAKIRRSVKTCGLTNLAATVTGTFARD